MMKLGIVGLLLISLLPVAGQENAAKIRFSVTHNGQPKPAPDHITLTANGRSLKVAVREGAFEAPQEVVGVPEVIFEADIGADHIRTTLRPLRFRVYGWRLLLADRSFGDDYPLVPKGAVVRSSCILAFDPNEGDGVVMFAPNCRSRRK